MLDAVNILQTVSIAIAAWTVKTLWYVTLKQTEHDQKIIAHHERINKLENQPRTPRG